MFPCFLFGLIIVTMPKVIKSAGREIILKVKEFCEAEKRNHELLIPLNNVRKRVAAMTGVSEKTVTRILQEGQTVASTSKKIVTPGKSRPHPKRINVDDFDLCTIRQKISQFYIVKKELPTLRKLRTVLQEDINFEGSITTLHRILHKIGYQYKRCQSKRKLLMERYDITAWRARYIEKIRKNRTIEKRPVIFLDETYIHNTYHTKKCWQSEQEPGLFTSESAGSRFIIAHAGSKNGFVTDALLIFKSQSKSSDYHDDMNSSNFLKWMTEKVIPNLPQKSLVVMDNAPYHCTQTNKAPTMVTLKADMQRWLRDKGIYFEENWNKAVLYDLIKQNKGPPVYTIDELLKQHQHEVLRLPPYHCDLNPIEKIWSLVKRRVAEKNVSQDVKQIVKLTEEAFASITPDDWRIQCEHVERLEDEYFRNDGLIDEGIERFIISTQSDSETESDDTDEDYENDSDSMSGITPLDHNYAINI